MTDIEVSEESPYKPFTTLDGQTLVSAMEKFKTPTGLEFDAFRNTSQERLHRRADALDKISEIIHDLEPETSPDFLDGRSSLSYEYMASYMVQRTENPRVKAEVARVWINEMIEDGDYYHAVNSLLYDGIPDTDIPEMQNPDFVGGLLGKALSEGNSYQAHRIAELVAMLEKKDEKDKIFKTVTEGSIFNEGWQARERILFDKHVMLTLEKASKTLDADPKVVMEVDMIFLDWSYREDGYRSENPHQLAIETAKAYCKFLNMSGRLDRAYQVAVECKLPYGDVKVYETQLPMAQQIKERLRRHFTQALQRVH